MTDDRKRAGPALGELLCRALGLDPNEISRITIDVPAAEVPTVTVERLVWVPEMEEMASHLSHYELERVDADKIGHRFGDARKVWLTDGEHTMPVDMTDPDDPRVEET